MNGSDLSTKSLEWLTNQLPFQGVFCSQQVFATQPASSILRKLKQQSFYLLSRDINRVNIAKNTVVTRMKQHKMAEMTQTGLGFLIDEFDDFTIDKAMNNEYYL